MIGTTAEECQTFINLCYDGKCTFKLAMEYIRKEEILMFRRDLLKSYIPKKLKKQIGIQCKLEGLL